MSVPLKLTKADVARALARHHFTPVATQMEAFERLRSVQFDPIAPVGCNHDLVLQARVPGYRVGDWEKVTYEDRLIYDGWDKQASLVPFEGWPWRRVFHRWYEVQFEKFLVEHASAVRSVLDDLAARGPMQPKDFDFQEKRADWKSTWHSSNVTKRVLRALWHSGQVMTSGRRKGQHLYDLTERVVPPSLYAQPQLTEAESVRELVRERHRAVGILRPTAPPEVWSYSVPAGPRKEAIDHLVGTGELVTVTVDGLTAHATPDFLAELEETLAEPRVTFVAPLDQIVWDRKMVAHVFGFDYSWEIYIPEAKRRWGYYVLPVLFGDSFVARAEFWCRGETLELRRWHFENGANLSSFGDALLVAVRQFMCYCSATRMTFDPSIDPGVLALLARVSPSTEES